MEPLPIPVAMRRRTMRECVVRHSGSATAATYILQGPYIRDAGRYLDSVWLTASSISSPVATVTVQYVDKNGTTRTIAPSVVTTNWPFTRPLKLHTQERLNFQIPADSMLQVTIVFTSGTLGSPEAHFHTFGG